MTELKHTEAETEGHKFFNMQKERNNFTDASSNVIAKLQSLEKPVYSGSKFSTSNATKKLASDTPSAVQTNSSLNINSYQLKSTRARSKEVVQSQLKSHHQSLNYYSKFENSGVIPDFQNNDIIVSEKKQRRCSPNSSFVVRNLAKSSERYTVKKGNKNTGPQPQSSAKKSRPDSKSK